MPTLGWHSPSTYISLEEPCSFLNSPLNPPPGDHPQTSFMPMPESSRKRQAGLKPAEWEWAVQQGQPSSLHPVPTHPVERTGNQSKERTLNPACHGLPQEIQPSSADWPLRGSRKSQCTYMPLGI